MESKACVSVCERQRNKFDGLQSNGQTNVPRRDFAFRQKTWFEAITYMYVFNFLPNLT